MSAPDMWDGPLPDEERYGVRCTSREMRTIGGREYVVCAFDTGEAVQMGRVGYGKAWDKAMRDISDKKNT